MKKLICILGLLFFSGSLYSQEWARPMGGGGTSVSELDSLLLRVTKTYARVADTTYLQSESGTYFGKATASGQDYPFMLHQYNDGLDKYANIIRATDNYGIEIGMISNTFNYTSSFFYNYFPYVEFYKSGGVTNVDLHAERRHDITLYRNDPTTASDEANYVWSQNALSIYSGFGVTKGMLLNKNGLALSQFGETPVSKSIFEIVGGMRADTVIVSKEIQSRAVRADTIYTPVYLVKTDTIIFTGLSDTIDCSKASIFYGTLAANDTIYIKNMVGDGARAQSVQIKVTNAGTNTLAWDTKISWPGSPPVLTATANKSDWFTLIKVNGITYGNYKQGY